MPPPTHIICAVRSRPGGEQTVKHAIELAQAHNARLTFFQVVDANFVNRFSTRGSSRKVIHRELAEIAEFTLSILCNQARQQGVAEAHYAVRQGNVREQLRALIRELRPDVLVMGKPAQSGPGESAFQHPALNEFIAELEKEGNLRVELS